LIERKNNIESIFSLYSVNEFKYYRLDTKVEDRTLSRVPSNRD